MRSSSRRAPRESKAGRFQAERQALKKIQVHLEFRQSLLRKVRLAAAAEDLSYSDYVRKLVGLPFSKIQRPRISLSFSDTDLRILSERYAKPGTEPQVLKRCVLEEIMAHLDDDEGSRAAH